MTRANGFDPGRFVAAREGIGLSRTDLARLAGIPETTILRWELGTHVPRIEHLRVAIEKLNEMRRRAKRAPLAAGGLIVVAPAERDLSDHRHLALLTPREVAAELGISVPTLTRIEKGSRPLTSAVVESLADMLRISADEVHSAWSRANRRMPELTVGEH
ncbi:helix-turn-helix transcriptional regulator [Nocardia sp. NPDC048505]|uniref:helix-turn-helix transcriptional regulator n=1 Tax=Nocardia sp. NPDC048505 TaxID=3155756 RepID=UPI0033E45A59